MRLEEKEEEMNLLIFVQGLKQQQLEWHIEDIR